MKLINEKAFYYAKDKVLFTYEVTNASEAELNQMLEMEKARSKKNGQSDEYIKQYCIKGKVARGFRLSTTGDWVIVNNQLRVDDTQAVIDQYEAARGNITTLTYLKEIGRQRAHQEAAKSLEDINELIGATA